MAAADTTYSAPSMAVDGSDINLAVVGSAGEPLFYYAASGSDTWHEELVSGPGSVT